MYALCPATCLLSSSLPSPIHVVFFFLLHIHHFSLLSFDPPEPQPPLNLTVVSVDMSSITIEWFPPEETFGSTRSYLVTYRRDELNAESTNVVETNVVIESTVTNTDSLSYTAQRLFPYTRYYIGVQTLNSRTKSISSYVYNATLEGGMTLSIILFHRHEIHFLLCIILLLC